MRHHFDSSAELYAHALVKILNQDFLLGFAWLLQIFSIALRFCLAHVHFGAAYYSLLISSEVRVFAGFWRSFMKDWKSMESCCKPDAAVERATVPLQTTSPATPFLMQRITPSTLLLGHMG